LIDRALGYDPSRRFTNGQEIQAALANITKSITANSETPPRGTGIDVHHDTPAFGHQPTQSEIPFKCLGPYRIDAKIGAGGMGDVYRGYDERLERTVAIKVLPRELARQQAFVDRFTSEARAVAKLVHPHIVPIYQIGEEQGHHYFAMQYIAGGSLTELLKANGKLPPQSAVQLIAQVVAGLAHAHEQGLVHRDIKPGNILIDHLSGKALLADFGLVKSLSSELQQTATGVVMGTVDYLSPEQGRGQPVDGRSDLYSVGVLLYQMLSGRLPFQADSPTSMIFQHAYEIPPPLTEIVSSVPADVAQIVHRLLLKDPNARYQTAGELLADLNRVQTGQSLSQNATATSRPTSVIYLPSEPASPSAAIKNYPSAFEQPAWPTRLRAFFNLHAPESLKNLQNTQQLVDGGLAVFQHRRQQLAALAEEAYAVERALTDQIALEQESLAELRQQQGNTPSAESEISITERETNLEYLESQLVEQRRQSQQIRQRLSEINSQLQNLRSQRDLLRARLETVQDRMHLEHDVTRNRKFRISQKVALIVAGLVGIVLLNLIMREPSLRPRDFDTVPVLQTGRNSAGDTITVAKGSVDLMSLIDVERDAISGTWNRDPRGRIWRHQREPGAASLVVPVLIDGSYELSVRFNSQLGTAQRAVAFQLPMGVGRGIVVLGVNMNNMHSSSISGVGGVMGFGPNDMANPTFNPDYVFKPGVEHNVVIGVRLAGKNVTIRVTDNKESVVDWTGLQSEIYRGMSMFGSPPTDDRFILTVWGNTVSFDRLSLQMFDGQATILQHEAAVPKKVPPGPYHGTWQINLPAGAQRAVTMLSMPKDELMLFTGGVLSGRYHWEDDRLVMVEPEDKRYQHLIWEKQGEDLVLVEEPPDHPSGARYVGTRLKFISPDTSKETQAKVPKLPSGVKKE
jgi:serine/threonine protein kinase